SSIEGASERSSREVQDAGKGEAEFQGLVSQPQITTASQTAHREWICYVALLIIVTVLWCAAYNRWTLDAWKTPIAYNGDAWAAMGIAKTFATGDVKPILPKYPASLGAPFVANWNDYPPAEGLFTWYGFLACLAGI